MASVEELSDPNQLKQVRQDVFDECAKYGEILEITIPTPITNLALKHVKPRNEEEVSLITGETGLVTAGCGKIFIHFSNEVAAKVARFNLSGRVYNGRTVIGSFYPEELFIKHKLDLI